MVKSACSLPSHFVVAVGIASVGVDVVDAVAVAVDVVDAVAVSFGSALDVVTLLALGLVIVLRLIHHLLGVVLKRFVVLVSHEKSVVTGDKVVQLVVTTPLCFHAVAAGEQVYGHPVTKLS